MSILRDKGDKALVLGVFARQKYGAVTSALCDLAAHGDTVGIERFFAVTKSLNSAALDGEALVDALGDAGEDDAVLTPLGAAVTSGVLATVAIILSRGAQASRPAGLRRIAPLHLAVGGGCSDAVAISTLLLQHDADTAQQTSDGSSPLHLACAAGELECATLLLGTEGGKRSLGMSSEGGVRPLMIAALAGHEPLVELLLSHNAQPDGLDGDSESLRTRDAAQDLEKLAQVRRSSLSVGIKRARGQAGSNRLTAR